jgi:hypothetical protein
MHSINVFLPIVFTLLTSVSANSISFYSWDIVDQYLCSTQPAGYQDFSGLVVHPHSGDNQLIIYPPANWEGAIHTVYADESCDDPHIVAEFRFQGFNGYTYYDISAVDNCCDQVSVHWVQPKYSLTPWSGCVTFPCDGSYTKPGDIETKSTPDIDMNVFGGHYYG